MSAPGEASPTLELLDCQSAVAIDLERLLTVAEKALPRCVGRALPTDNVLPALDEIEISIVDDAAIASVHGEFLGDPTPTDVITFDHGEILVSAETAAARASEFGNPTDRELALYVIHGLLHLAGYKDKTADEFEAMKAAQEAVLAECW